MIVAQTSCNVTISPTAGADFCLTQEVLMIQEQVDRMNLGWSREQLARASGVTTAAVYLLERMGSAGSEDDARIRKSLAEGKAKHATPQAKPGTEGFVQSASNKVLNFPNPKRFTSSDSKDVEGLGEANDGNSASPADMAWTANSVDPTPT